MSRTLGGVDGLVIGLVNVVVTCAPAGIANSSMPTMLISTSPLAIAID
jgi:hypothetical protein